MTVTNVKPLQSQYEKQSISTLSAKKKTIISQNEALNTTLKMKFKIHNWCGTIVYLQSFMF